MNADTRKCRYCQFAYSGGAKEHVFPKGLGGPNIFMDNVCENCNRKFSHYERELMRDSPVAFMRSVEGIEGYKRSHVPAGAFLAPILLTFDDQSKIVYEVGQRYPLENFIRPQMILIKGGFYIEGDKREGLEMLGKKFAQWKRDVRIIALKIRKNDTVSLQWIEFVDNGSNYETVVQSSNTKSKDIIKIDILTDTHDLFRYLSPRLFLNDLGELWVRARDLDDAVSFLIKLMNYTRVRVALSSYPKTFTNPLIYVGQNFNNLQFSQCLVKIGINCLMYYYPAFKDDESMNECISFVMTGNGKIELKGEEKDNIKDFGEGTHSLFFQQTSYGMNVRIAFFNGTGGAFTFDVVGLKILMPGEFNRLVVDYKSHTMEFQDRIKFLSSFDQKK
ncbi:hypothetical protein [Ohtaekwangia koreensis]|uniref:HNH endonuclease n=1 Tax=Ohtaekwangia koreensis TaxID=688867 RepID=A0A1T5J7C5_9BACT|nr:hypothetical protein [Ohtaekwangia koreensis]SKC47153.1 hypothetical protein SAMN05660236_0824 [Ohtaekwangia koreensis]